MAKKKRFFMLALLITLILLSLILLLAHFFLNANEIKRINNIIDSNVNLSCVTSYDKMTVSGDSLKGIIDSGSCVSILQNYYLCNEVKRDDIVAYSYKGNNNPIIKIVKGIPNDSFEIKSQESGYIIIINNITLRNSEEKPYMISDGRILTLYANDYPVIPKDSYFLLGNIETGSLDSTRFGLVSRNDIIGKIQKC